LGFKTHSDDPEIDCHGDKDAQNVLPQVVSLVFVPKAQSSIKVDDYQWQLASLHLGLESFPGHQ
jgi:hypothetical protein